MDDTELLVLRMKLNEKGVPLEGRYLILNSHGKQNNLKLEQRFGFHRLYAEIDEEYLVLIQPVCQHFSRDRNHVCEICGAGEVVCFIGGSANSQMGAIKGRPETINVPIARPITQENMQEDAEIIMSDKSPIHNAKYIFHHEIKTTRALAYVWKEQ